MRRRSFFAVFLAALTVLAALPDGRAMASAPLASITLRLSDLRPGYVVRQSRVRTPSNIDSFGRVAGQLLLSHGWVSGYDERFARGRTPAIQVGEIADRFRTTTGAHWWYGASLLRVPTDYHTISMPRVGDESTAVQSHTWVGMIFRRGTDVIDVYVSLQAPVPAAAVLWFARVVDRRLLQDQTSPPATRTRTTTRAVAVKTWVRTRAIPTGAYVTVYAKSVPGARCTAVLLYSTGPSRLVFHGYTWLVGKSGVVNWRWLAQAKGNKGSATVTCTYSGRSKTAKTNFRVRR